VEWKEAKERYEERIRPPKPKAPPKKREEATSNNNCNNAIKAINTQITNIQKQIKQLASILSESEEILSESERVPMRKIVSLDRTIVDMYRFLESSKVTRRLDEE
jgi:predicted  nucleic acid-binding Zn-ribbon protein